MRVENPPEWLDGLLKRIDTLSETLQEYDGNHGRMLGAVAEMRATMRRLETKLDAIAEDFGDEKTKRRDEDLSIRRQLARAESRMNAKNAGAGALSGALLVVIQWAVQTFGG